MKKVLVTLLYRCFYLPVVIDFRFDEVIFLKDDHYCWTKIIEVVEFLFDSVGKKDGIGAVYWKVVLILKIYKEAIIETIY